MSLPQVGSPVNAFPDGPGGECSGVIPESDMLSAALGPKSVTTGQTTVEERDLSDLIALDEYLAKRRQGCGDGAKYTGWGGIKLHKAIPPGPT